MTTPDPTPAAVREAMRYLARKRWAPVPPDERSAKMKRVRSFGRNLPRKKKGTHEQGH